MINIQKEVLRKEGQPESFIEFIDHNIFPESDEYTKPMSTFRATALVVEARNGQQEFINDAKEAILAISNPTVIFSQEPENMGNYSTVLREVMDGHQQSQILSESSEDLSTLIHSVFDQLD